MRTLDGTMVSINDVKNILRSLTYTDRKFSLVDTSGPHSFGYRFELVEKRKRLADFTDDNGNVLFSEHIWEPVRIVARTHDTSMPAVRNKGGNIGAYGPTFDRSDLDDLYAALRRN